MPRLSRPPALHVYPASRHTHIVSGLRFFAFVPAPWGKHALLQLNSVRCTAAGNSLSSICLAGVPAHESTHGCCSLKSSKPVHTGHCFQGACHASRPHAPDANSRIACVPEMSTTYLSMFRRHHPASCLDERPSAGAWPRWRLRGRTSPPLLLLSALPLPCSKRRRPSSCLVPSKLS